MVIYTLTKFDADWFVFVDDIACKQSYFHQFFQIQGQITLTVFGSIWPIIELIRDLMGIYIVAKFGTDCSILADARV